ncbi:hypothetical protein [uncultured virus]|uniref:Uncharacterized protein n=1 Tax=uncultured virus TaxID=340016 RepID=A0A218MLU3_9VIRU|nr:hypothetical protein [uncultured virus]
MAGYSARQATYTSGDTITAAHSNDEFNQLLAAFNASTGHTHDGTAGDGGPVTTLRDSDALNKILVDTSNNHLEFYVEVSSAAVQQLRIQDGAIVPITDSDIDLGTSSLEFKDLFIDGTANIDALVADTADINGGTVDGATLGTNSAITQAVIDNININGATIGHTDDTDLLTLADGVLTVAGEVSMTTLDIGGTNITSTAAELNILDGVTSTASELNLVDGITAGTVSASKAVIVDSNKDLTGLRNLTISGDLTVSGDDITMGTNTAGNLLIADGTNFNSIAATSLSEISTVANDDVFIAVDTSGGGLKKIARSAIVAGLATSSAISNVVEDTTPQLGGNLDMNGADIVTTSNADIELAANGTGKVVIKGNTNQGAIKFNCEANSHGQIVIAAPHSESASNTLTLPSTGGDARLVSTSSTATLTNKTLTTPVIAEIDNSSDITLDAGADIILDAGGADVTLKDDGTTFGSLTNSSGELVIKSGSTPTTAMTFSGANVTFAGTVTIGSAGISEAELEILDGATVTTAELNILDGVTSTAAELNILDGVTSTAAELNILDGVTSTAAEINIIDGDTSASATTLVDADRLVTNDAGTMKQVALTDVKTYLNSAGFVTDDPTALAIALG